MKSFQAKVCAHDERICAKLLRKCLLSDFGNGVLIYFFNILNAEIMFFEHERLSVSVYLLNIIYNIIAHLAYGEKVNFHN